MKTKASVIAAAFLMLLAAFSNQKAQAPTQRTLQVVEKPINDSVRAKLDTFLLYRERLSGAIQKAEQNTSKLERLSAIIRQQSEIIDKAILAYRADSERITRIPTPAIEPKAEVKVDIPQLAPKQDTVRKEKKSFWNQVFRKN